MTGGIFSLHTGVPCDRSVVMSMWQYTRKGYRVLLWTYGPTMDNMLIAKCFTLDGNGVFGLEVSGDGKGRGKNVRAVKSGVSSMQK